MWDPKELEKIIFWTSIFMGFVYYVVIMTLYIYMYAY